MKINEIFVRITMPRALILGAFLTSLYYFFVFDSGDIQSKALATTKTEFTAANRQLNDIKAKLDHAHEYQRSASEMGETLNKLLAYIPENFRLQDFMKTVSEEAKIAGLNINNVTDAKVDGSKSERSTDFEALGVNVELQGTFAQQMTFLANLTKQKQIFLIERFSMDRDSSARVPVVNANGENDAPTLVFKAEIRAYRYIGGKKKS